MDTVEELNGTYFYKGYSNLSAGELLFWIFLDETAEHFRVGDYLTIGLILLGQPEIATRGKPTGATLGTSPLSKQLRHYLDIETRRLPTLTTGSIRRRKFTYVTNLGAFVGRWIPIIGIIIIAADVSTIAYKSTNKYNTIARGNDKLW
ncbi:hypothetical protein C3432_07520 [Citrobacter amalonaticus]|uniref:Phage membrane protein n=1 Tax=Citrobacter amalonaticus TaxID=35703 RepID=A0A2S4RY80_CITAM|nr:hypothetical protein [Citrobacter amalonaticus]POT57782.1 hypothetical protein C3432_07520 [Citrobacter amalonaticus]POT76691.1 hypothetical protein C3436_04305 [Citrobacter amalonaticus]POU65770.1 hypothetical protein C3430_10720 [Citrobacter amalonaticus]POV05927.1 hypothetical protein C3424_11605 [Citrobacter amalonaticus]